MKNILHFISIFLVLSCTNSSTEEEQVEVVLTDNVVRIEVLTGEPNNDELFITYYEYETDTYNWNAYPFSYDGQGNPEPIIITFDDYDFRYIEGEVYRNNPSSASISLKIYLNDELIIDETKIGDGIEYVLVKFNYDIKIMSSI